MPGRIGWGMEYVDTQSMLIRFRRDALQRAATIGEEKNRALKAAQNAELRCSTNRALLAGTSAQHVRCQANGGPASRRAKGQVLTEELPRLEKLVRRGKKLTEEVIHDRLAKACAHSCLLLQRCTAALVLDSCLAALVQVKYLRESVESVPDGVHNARKPFKVSCKALGCRHNTATLESRQASRHAASSCVTPNLVLREHCVVHVALGYSGCQGQGEAGHFHRCCSD